VPTVTVLTSAVAAGRLRSLRHAGLVVVSLFLAHEAAYLVRFGDPGHTATIGREPGHAYWPALLLIAGAALAMLALRAAWRLTIGAHRAAALAAPPAQAANPGPAGYRAEWRGLFTRLAPTVVALFLVQENLEHALAHGHVDGLAVYLGAGKLLTLPVVLAVVAAVAAIGALVRWQESQIVRRLRAARLALARPPRAARPALGWDITAASVRRQWFGDDLRGRAPPRAIAA
jgi:hypothetical protein